MIAGRAHRTQSAGTLRHYARKCHPAQFSNTNGGCVKSGINPEDQYGHINIRYAARFEVPEELFKI